MNDGFQGYARQGVAKTLLGRATNPSTGAVETPDALPTYRVYGPSGYAGINGTCGNAESGAVTGATNASPIAITAVAHGLTTGQTVTIAGVGGNTAANGTYQITRTGSDTFTLNGTTGNGAYTSGGTWATTGLFTVALSAPDTQSLTPGESYTVVASWTVGSSPRTWLPTFGVN